jgi:type II secretory ATPase GspE/PulE/Tfp pilus assembly ATPase PilB-like protein
VMRLLDPRTIKKDIEELGMRKDLLEKVKGVLKKPTGAILTTGPTGSGKTTMLYSFVNRLNSPDKKIITIEDPVEYHIEGISQTQVDARRDYTFANGLRAIVRQDPDIILVGEIRDTETADIALQAALTGHLVLSTIHTNDAAGTIPRLIDLGIRPQIIAPAINMAMAQRLVRKLCSNCKKVKKIEAEDLKKVKTLLEPLRERLSLPKLDSELEIGVPGKCKECNESGYKGRIGVFEAFEMSREVEKLILKSPAISEVRDLIIAEGMITMPQDAYLKLIEGVTSMEEIERVLG